MKAVTHVQDYFRSSSSPAEKKLVLKLDVVILSFCCLTYFVNYFDRSSVTQAYVSGMKEDLHFVGAQLTEVTTLYAVGYLIGIVPNNLLLTYFKPRNFFPFMITAWSFLTMVNATARNPKDLMAIRFVQGYFESCVFAGTQYILGSWYTKQELGRRTGLFTASGLAGGMFGGFLQSGIYSSMDGLQGLEGWRWLYIICGIIGLPVAMFGYLFFPDTPHTTSAFYLTEEEKQLARQRIPILVESESILSIAFVKKVVYSWYFYGFCMLWILGNCSESQSTQSLMNLYMQALPDKHYSVSQLNNYPTGVQAMGIISTLLWALGTDIWGGRWMSGYYVAVTAIGNAVILIAPSSTVGAKFAAYYWAGTIYCIQATFFAWANDSMRSSSPTLRACIIACMNSAGNCFQAWWPLIFYRSDDAPKFIKGTICMMVIGAAMAIWTTIMIYMDRRIAKTSLEGIDAVENSSAAASENTPGKSPGCLTVVDDKV